MADALGLFDAGGSEGAWTVSQVTRRARSIVEQGMGPLWVRELTSFKAYQSGTGTSPSATSGRSSAA
jgi:hypothetical protein